MDYDDLLFEIYILYILYEDSGNINLTHFYIGKLPKKRLTLKLYHYINNSYSGTIIKDEGIDLEVTWKWLDHTEENISNAEVIRDEVFDCN